MLQLRYGSKQEAIAFNRQVVSRLIKETFGSESAKVILEEIIFTGIGSQVWMALLEVLLRNRLCLHKDHNKF